MAIPVRLKVFQGDVLVTSQEKGRLSFGDDIKVGGTTLRLERVRGVAALESEPAPVAEAALAPVEVPVPGVEVPVPAAVPERPSTPRVRRAAPRKARGPLGVSLRFQWGDRNVGEFFVAPGARKGFSVGTAEGVDFVMGDARLGGPRFEVLRTDGQGFSVCFTGGMRGGLTRGGETRDLEAVLESGLASHEGESYALSLEAEDFLWMDLGGVTLEVCFQPVPRRAAAPLTESLDFTVVNIFLVTFFLAAFFVISAAHHGADESAYADDLANDSSRIAKLIVKAPEAQQRNRLLRQLNDQRREEVARLPSRPREERSPPVRTPPRAVAERLPPKGQRGGAAEARTAVRNVFGGSGLSSLLQGSGNQLASALDRVDGGPRTSATGAFGMLGPRTGPGSGGGGRPSASSASEASTVAPRERPTTAMGRSGSARSGARTWSSPRMTCRRLARWTGSSSARSSSATGGRSATATRSSSRATRRCPARWPSASPSPPRATWSPPPWPSPRWATRSWSSAWPAVSAPGSSPGPREEGAPW